MPLLTTELFRDDGSQRINEKMKELHELILTDPLSSME